MESKIKEILLGTFSEDFTASNNIFIEDDSREFLYSTNNFIPCSSLESLFYRDKNAKINNVADIIDKGDKIVTTEIAEMIMAFDPFGVEVYPINLKIKDGVIKNRHLISFKNIIDAIDYNQSDIEDSPYPDIPELADPIIGALVISSEKLMKVPYSKRIIFRVKGADDTVFFDGALIDYAIAYFDKHGASGIQITPFFTGETAPIM